MELPRRTRGDELLKPGEMINLRQRMRKLAAQNDLVTVIACAFDHRTRMLPFIYADTRMAPAGVRSIGAAMVDAGFPKTRIVLQQWNRHFRPSTMQLDGRIPDLFMVSTMGLHLGQAMAMIRDAQRIDPAHRPLIIAGGPQARYQPDDLFSGDPKNPASADVVVTGEEYVLLSLLEVLLSTRATGESMRSAFFRARDSGALDNISGLVFGRGGNGGLYEEMVDTGIQRLLGDLDELPDPVPGYAILEAPSRRSTLASQPLAANRVNRYSPISSVVLTYGCKFACQYCPIPGYNQRQYRSKSGQRMAEEMWGLYKNYGVRHFFGCDDNFFNDEKHTLGIIETLATAEFDGTLLRSRHEQDEGAPAADSRGRLPGFVAGRRGHDRVAGEKGPERQQHDGGIRRPARRGHLPHADDDAPRFPAALQPGLELRAAQSGAAAAKVRGAVSSGLRQAPSCMNRPSPPGRCFALWAGAPSRRTCTTAIM
jgi:hypothetical protein